MEIISNSGYHLRRLKLEKPPDCPVVNKTRVGAIIKKVKAMAVAYYRETGKPLGVTGEVAEWEAAEVLGFKLCRARQDGYDAFQTKDGRFKRISIKGRRLLEASRPGQRLGSIRLKHEWDSVVLVLLDEDFEPKAMYEAERADIQRELLKPGSRARNERGALSINKFKSIAKQVWKAK